MNREQKHQMEQQRAARERELRRRNKESLFEHLTHDSSKRLKSPTPQEWEELKKKINVVFGGEHLHSSMADTLATFASASEKASKNFQVLVDNMVKSNNFVFYDTVGFWENAFALPESQVLAPTVIAVSDLHAWNVIYQEENDGAINSVPVPESTIEEAWLIVDYLVGDDCVPLTIVKNDEVMAYRPQKTSGALFHEYWIGQEGMVPDEYGPEPENPPYFEDLES